MLGPCPRGPSGTNITNLRRAWMNPRTTCATSGPDAGLAPCRAGLAAAASSGMAHKLITCPETAHLEMIEYQEDSLGILIDACTRFRPACDVECPRTCAARLDRREQRCGQSTSVEVPHKVLHARSLLRSYRS